MRNLSLRSVLLLVALCFVTAGMAVASSTYDFPADSSIYFSATNGSDTIGNNGGETAFMWTQGDLVTDFAFGAPDPITSALFNFTVEDFLGSMDENVGIYINGIGVGDFTVAACNFCDSLVNYSVNTTFAPISGGTYQWAFVLNDTIDLGNGSIAFTNGGTVVVNAATPEPGSLALLGSGILGLAGILRRKSVV